MLTKGVLGITDHNACCQFRRIYINTDGWRAICHFAAPPDRRSLVMCRTIKYGNAFERI